MTLTAQSDAEAESTVITVSTSVLVESVSACVLLVICISLLLFFLNLLKVSCLASQPASQQELLRSKSNRTAKFFPGWRRWEPARRRVIKVKKTSF